MAKSKSKTKSQRRTSPPPPPPPQQPLPSLLRQACKFFGTTAGLDLTLRLFQGLVIISAKAADEVVATRSFIASAQLDLARRYLRFFVLLDCIHNVLDTIAKEHASLAYKTLDLVEWSCLLMYFALENLTMLHDMKIHVLPWYRPVLVEANKFWLYAILASIARTVIRRAGLLFSRSPARSSKREQQQQQQQHPPPPPLRRLVIDALDLCLPASFIGWVAIDDVTIGCIMTLSTLLVWRDVWAKAQ
ncbi:PEX11 domain-containing protein [Cordyceps javanica]|uniref:PEX11 domain-containing protein n=1 Tax=Cordyceps javanica TaxID=43265 RepID=A0A545VHK7_9HYPO|nr:PEX11 domain-containing protein [Cordyceps javanica]TQW12295.1 PEX11 domain protein [Cordyceps javanica]